MFSQVVVNALIQAIPAIFNVLLVCLVFWLIFSIMGVNLFGGRFESCINASGEIIFNQSISNKNDCLANAHLNYSWENPKINFDNVPAAYLALFQVVSSQVFYRCSPFYVNR
jgi:Ion transport protein